MREPGYYWVKLGGKWEVVLYDRHLGEDYLWQIGVDEPIKTEPDYFEVGERINPPK